MNRQAVGQKSTPDSHQSVLAMFTAKEEKMAEGMIEKVARAIEADVHRLVYEQKHVTVGDLTDIAAIAIEASRSNAEKIAALQAEYAAGKHVQEEDKA